MFTKLQFKPVSSVFLKSLLFLFLPFGAAAQCGDCPYPVIFLHGLDGDDASFSSFYTDGNFTGIWGGLTDVFHGVLNAQMGTSGNAALRLTGTDGVLGNNDDDVLVQFVNETNTLSSGCVYALNWNNFWNQNQASPSISVGTGTSVSNNSNSNQSAIYRQGYAVKKAIEKVLAANPTKTKVILVGHSMGGLESREYLQRVEGGAYKWWVTPTDHKVAKLFTVGTPHRGSNSGTFAIDPNGNTTERNSVPDISSEAVRDLRYEYPSNSNYRGVYLYGGNETGVPGFHNQDVNADGSNTTAGIIGINQAGSPLAQDGTKENPAMGLPNDVKYTYYVGNQFNVFCGNPSGSPAYGCAGDGVVDDQRQWLFSGGANGYTSDFYNGVCIPSPTDGVNHRLSDRLTSTVRIFHTGEPGDLDFVVRGLDEGDYPYFAHDISSNINVWFAGIPQIRADIVPTASERTNTANNKVDGDWYKVTIPTAVANAKLELYSNPSLPVRADFYQAAPTAYSNADAPLFFNSAAGTSSLIALTTPTTNAVPLAAGTYYFRITHSNVTATSWHTCYKFRIITTPLVPLAAQLLTFDGVLKNNEAQLSWTVAQEKNVADYGVEKSRDGVHFQNIGTVKASNVLDAHRYELTDKTPFAGDNYYRLATHDQDGSVENSNTVYLRTKEEFKAEISPNPVNGNQYLNVKMSGVQADYITFEVLDMAGKLLSKQFLSGENQRFDYQFSVNELAKGTYALRLSDGKNISIQKFVVE